MIDENPVYVENELVITTFPKFMHFEKYLCNIS
jgi:hypothetical protein